MFDCVGQGSSACNWCLQHSCHQLWRCHICGFSRSYSKRNRREERGVTDTDTDTDCNSHANSDTHTHANSDTHTHANSDTHTDCNSHANSDTHTNTDTHGTNRTMDYSLGYLLSITNRRSSFMG
jgi:hypothetical protein